MWQIIDFELKHSTEARKEQYSIMSAALQNMLNNIFFFSGHTYLAFATPALACISIASYSFYVVALSESNHNFFIWYQVFFTEITNSFFDNLGLTLISVGFFYVFKLFSYYLQDIGITTENFFELFYKYLQFIIFIFNSFAL